MIMIINTFALIECQSVVYLQMTLQLVTCSHFAEPQFRIGQVPAQPSQAASCVHSLYFLEFSILCSNYCEFSWLLYLGQ